MATLFDVKCESWKWFSDSVQFFNEEQLHELYKVILCVQRRSIASLNKVESYKDLIDLFTPSKKLVEKSCECPYTAITILPNGDVTFCTDFPDVILGNIYDTNLNDIWIGEKGQLFRKYLETNKRFPLCESCVHRNKKLI